jgi:hypothetical protein
LPPRSRFFNWPKYRVELRLLQGGYSSFSSGRPAYAPEYTCHKCASPAIWRVYPRASDPSDGGGWLEACQKHVPKWVGARRFYLPKFRARQTALLLLQGDST